METNAALAFSKLDGDGSAYLLGGELDTHLIKRIIITNFDLYTPETSNYIRNKQMRFFAKAWSLN